MESEPGTSALLSLYHLFEILSKQSYWKWLYCTSSSQVITLTVPLLSQNQKIKPHALKTHMEAEIYFASMKYIYFFHFLSSLINTVTWCCSISILQQRLSISAPHIHYAAETKRTSLFPCLFLLRSIACIFCIYTTYLSGSQGKPEPILVNIVQAAGFTPNQSQRQIAIHMHI